MQDMHNILIKLIILSSFCAPRQAYAQANFTQIDESILYSEYYPNNKSKFRGTIIFQNGAGVSLKEWTHSKAFFKCLTQQGSAFMHDRSGLGQSSPDYSISLKSPITAQHVNSKLIRLLKRNKIQSPYIIVSHSYGGLYAGYFARKYPHLIAGMLMVDPVPSDYQYTNQFLEKFRINLAKWTIFQARKHINLTTTRLKTKAMQ